MWNYWLKSNPRNKIPLQCLVFSRNAKRSHRDQIYYKGILLCLKRNTHTHTHTHTHTSQKPSKIAAAENLFPSLYAIGTAMNVFITYDIYKTLFNTEIYRYLEIFWEPPCFCVFWGKYFERNSDFMFSISTIILQCC